MHSGSNNSISQQNSSTLKKRKIKEESAIASTVTMKGTGKAPSSDDSCLIFSVKDINRYPLPGCFEPSSVAFSPDDKLISYLYSPDNTLNRDIFAFDPSSGKQQKLLSLPEGDFDESILSNEEKLWRERLRERGLGITCYEWVKSSQSPRIMVPLPNGIYFLDAPSSELRLRLPSTSWSPIINPHLSPDGTMIAFVRDDEICVMSVSHGKPKQISNGARGNQKTHGLAEYIAQEEMERKNGFWWSADSSHIAFTQVDTTEIPIFRIMHQGKATIGANAREDHHYPFAGNSNAKVRLGVTPAFGGGITWMDVNCGIKGKGNDDEEYLARVSWMPENVLIAQVLNRAHSKLKLLKFDIRSGRREVLLVEENDIWINLHDCFAPLNKGIDRFAGGFIWASERSGFRHLYLYDQTGTCLGPITEGIWMIDQLIGVNEHKGLVYFTGTVDSPLETNLYSTKLFPDWRFPLQNPQRLTQGRGGHVVILDHQMKRFVDIHHSLSSPPRVWLCSLEDGSLLMPIYEQPFPTPHARRLQLSPPDQVQISAGDGTILYGALYKPDINRFGPPPYRTMISVYGGPNVQTVYNSWTNTVDMRAQYLRSKGILVWKLDNRGSARRGLKFEGALKYNLGLIDVEDQETGAKWLIEKGLANPGRIGLYGWSYGGYIAAMAMGRCPGTFKCAVAGAPVTAWDGYDTFYTEKYMGMPSNNPAGYEYSSVLHHVHGIKGKLLLVHGMIDENVHFRHTARLVNALIESGKTYELLLFPDERHTVRQYRMYMEERIWEFIDRNL